MPILNGLEWVLPRGSTGKEPVCNAGDRSCGFNLWVGKISWRRKWQPIPVFLPGESLEQRSLLGYSPWGHRELDMTEHAHMGSGVGVLGDGSTKQESTV